jgi:hypothetical protein
MRYNRGTQRMVLKKRSAGRKKVSSAPKKPRTSAQARIPRPRRKESVAAPTTTPRSLTYARVTQHARVTAGRSHKRPTLGFFDPAKAIHAGNTAHFDVSYLSRLGKKGANSAARAHHRMRRIADIDGATPEGGRVTDEVNNNPRNSSARQRRPGASIYDCSGMCSGPGNQKTTYYQ